MKTKRKEKSLSLINVNPEKCVQCFACIDVCPVKFCNDASGEAVLVNSDLCIGCGKCISACKHGARLAVDDFDAFLSELERGKKVVVIADPAFALRMGSLFGKLLTYLQSAGVAAVFDGGIGVQLYSTLAAEELKSERKSAFSSQCPAVLSYLKIYRPNLVKHLLAVPSPPELSRLYITRHFSEFADARFVYFSSCLARKREFESIKNGMLNVGSFALERFLTVNGIVLNELPESSFHTPSYSSAVLNAFPGGLSRMIRPRPKSFVLSGESDVFSCLASFDEDTPLGFCDLMSCSRSCSGGPLFPSIGSYEHILLSSEADSEVSLSENDTILPTYEPDYPKRVFRDWSLKNKILFPGEDDLRNVYHQMYKFTEKDFQNCGACGYGSCETMAVAIFNGLNQPQNCYFYLKRVADHQSKEHIQRNVKFRHILETSLEGFIEMDDEFHIQTVNKSFTEIFKRRKSDVIGASLFEFATEKGKDVLSLEKKKVDLGLKTSFEASMLSGLNTEIICLFNVSPLYDNYENRFGSFAMVTNVTDKKNSEKLILQMNADLEMKVKKRTEALTRSLDTIQRDQEAGKKVQFQLLPRQQICLGDYCLSHRIIPSLFLSGDFVDYFRVDENRIAFYIADVSGHGASSAFVTIFLKSYISYALHNYRSGEDRMILEPDKLIEKLNADLLHENLDKHLTLFFGIIDEKKNELTFSNAGHYPFPILFEETPDFIEIKGFPVGLLDFATYHSKVISLPKKFLLVFFSDGILEILPERDIHLQRKFLLDAVDRIDLSIEELIQKMGVNPALEQPDDLTFLAIRRGVKHE